MRIVSGKHRGRRISAPKKLPVRPTTDMAKEALFNILNNRFYFDELKVLDLFAGTGNISYEFASRGTTAITAVDANAGCAAFIGKTARVLEMDINPIKSDVFDYLKKVVAKSDIIFADPPYGMSIEAFALIPELVFQNGLLHPEGVLIIEHSDQMDLSPFPYFNNKRKYGSSVFSFFEQEPAT